MSDFRDVFYYDLPLWSIVTSKVGRTFIDFPSLRDNFVTGFSTQDDEGGRCCPLYTELEFAEAALASIKAEEPGLKNTSVIPIKTPSEYLRLLEELTDLDFNSVSFDDYDDSVPHKKFPLAEVRNEYRRRIADKSI